MRLSARRWRRQLMAVAAALLVGAAYGQDFSDASMNGVYAFVVEPQTEAGQAAPTHGRWLLVQFNGDGTWEMLWIGANVPSANADGTRDVVAGAFALSSATYRVMPNGAIELMGADGSVAWDGLIVRSEMRDGVLVATEYVLFNRVPDDVTGALRMGRGTLQKPMAEGP